MTCRLYGGSGSPFRARSGPYCATGASPNTWPLRRGGFIGASKRWADGESSPLQRAGKTVIPVLETPYGSFVADTTPIM